jgi:hypothetical protein
MVEPSEGMKLIARALIGDPPGTPEKKAIHEQVGRAIVELSNAENYLALIFVVLSMPVDMKEAKELFASQGQFERKLKLVNFMVLHQQHELAKWEHLYAQLNNHRGVRNLIAHQRLFVEYQSNSPLVDVALVPLLYKEKGKSLSTKEIKGTADKLEKIVAELWSFIATLDKRSKSF